LAEAWRPDEEHMVERFAPAFRGFDEDFQIGARRRLTDEFVERLRPQCLLRVLAALFGSDEAGGEAHARSSMPATDLAAPGSKVKVFAAPSSRFRKAIT